MMHLDLIDAEFKNEWDYGSEGEKEALCRWDKVCLMSCVPERLQEEQTVTNIENFVWTTKLLEASSL